MGWAIIQVPLFIWNQVQETGDTSWLALTGAASIVALGALGGFRLVRFLYRILVPTSLDSLGIKLKEDALEKVNTLGVFTNTPVKTIIIQQPAPAAPAAADNTAAPVAN